MVSFYIDKEIVTAHTPDVSVAFQIIADLVCIDPHYQIAMLVTDLLVNILKISYILKYAAIIFKLATGMHLSVVLNDPSLVPDAGKRVDISEFP